MQHFGANHFAAYHFAARHLRSVRAALDIGGGGGSKGWAHERAILEASLKRTKDTIQASPNKVAKRVVKKLNAYLDDNIDIESLAKEVAALRIEISNRDELARDLQAAQAELEAFIKDEQEAIDILMAAMEYDRAVLSSVHHA